MIRTCYFVVLLLMVFRIYKFTLKSHVFREKIPVYISILAALIIAQFIYLMNEIQVDWHASKLVDYFLYLTQVVYLSTIILGHVYLRRFIVN